MGQHGVEGASNHGVCSGSSPPQQGLPIEGSPSNPSVSLPPCLFLVPSCFPDPAPLFLPPSPLPSPFSSSHYSSLSVFMVWGLVGHGDGRVGDTEISPSLFSHLLVHTARLLCSRLSLSPSSLSCSRCLLRARSRTSLSLPLFSAFSLPSSEIRPKFCRHDNDNR